MSSDGNYNPTDPTEIEMAASVYSDVYKEVYGIRARWQRWPENVTADEIWAAVDALHEVASEQERINFGEFTVDSNRTDVDAMMQPLDDDGFEKYHNSVEDRFETVASRKGDARLNRKRHASRR